MAEKFIPTVTISMEEYENLKSIKDALEKRVPIYFTYGTYYVEKTPENKFLIDEIISLKIENEKYRTISIAPNKNTKKRFFNL